MPANREADTKHGVTFWLCKAYDLPDDLDYYLIRANEEILSQIGANVFGQGARFPGLENGVKQFPYNDDARAKLQFIGLELMGAYVLSFTSTIDNSPDASYHLTWQPDAVDKGHWNIELLVPSDVDEPGITSVEATTLDCGESATLSLVSGVLHLGIPKGCDGADGSNGTNGTDGSDGREIELRVAGGFIQWRYVGDVTWVNLLATSTLIGATGATGATGAKGDKGDKGDTGGIGDMGLQGIQGEPGEKGDKGDTGDPCVNCPPDTPTTTATTGEDTPCNVSYGVGNWAASKCRDVFSRWAVDVADSMLLTDTIDDLLSVFPIIGEVWHVFLQFSADVTAIGLATAQSELTTDFVAETVCLLYCSLGTDGALTDTVISTWIASVAALTGYSGFGPIYAKFLGSLLPSEFRKIGLLYQHVDGACGCLCDCPVGSDWSSAIDLLVSDGSFARQPGELGVWALHEGWKTEFLDSQDNTYLAIRLTFTSTTLTRLWVTYDRDAGSGANALSRISTKNGGTFTRDSFSTAAGTGVVVKPIDGTGRVANQIDIDMNCGTSGGHARVYKVILCGTGTKPPELP